MRIQTHHMYQLPLLNAEKSLRVITCASQCSHKHFQHSTQVMHLCVGKKAKQIVNKSKELCVRCFLTISERVMFCKELGVKGLSAS